MSSTIIPDNGNNTIQTGPVYCCPECGAACTGIDSAEEAHAVFGALPRWMQDWKDHVGYLKRAARCGDERHFGCRVVRLGAAILPVDWPRHTPEEERIVIIREALDRIAQEVGPAGAPHAPAASIVYRLLAGVLAPQTAITEIRELVHSAEAPEPEPEYIFQHQQGEMV